MEKISYLDWIKRDSVKNDFYSDMRKRFLYRPILMAILGSFFIGVIVFGLLLLGSMKTWGIILISLGVLFLVLDIIFIRSWSKLKLNKKYFSVYLLKEISKYISSNMRESDRKKLDKLIKKLNSLFDKNELEEFYDSFYFDSVNQLKKEMALFSKNLKYRFIKSQINSKKDGEILNKISMKLYSEESLDNIILILENYNKENLVLESSPTRKILKNIFFWWIIITIFLSILGLILDINKNYIFAFFGLSTVTFFAAIIQNQKK